MSNLSPAQPAPPPASAILGNFWLLAAAWIRSTAAVPSIITLDRDGQLRAHGMDYPEVVSSPDFVCLISEASDPHRIASRIRAAVERQAVTHA